MTSPAKLTIFSLAALVSVTLPAALSRAAPNDAEYNTSIKCGTFFGFMNLVKPGAYKSKEMFFIRKGADRGEALGKSDEEVRQDFAAYRSRFSRDVQAGKIKNDAKTHEEFELFCERQMHQ